MLNTGNLTTGAVVFQKGLVLVVQGKKHTFLSSQVCSVIGKGSGKEAAPEGGRWGGAGE